MIKSIAKLPTYILVCIAFFVVMHIVCVILLLYSYYHTKKTPDFKAKLK